MSYPLPLRTHKLFALLVVALFLLCTGCAKDFPEFPAKSVADCPLHNQTAGLLLGAELIHDADTSRKYFDTDLLNEKILPVYVVVENRSTHTYLIESQQFSVRGINALNKDHTKPASDAGTAVAYTGAVLGSLPLTFVGMGIVVGNQNIQSNIKNKAIKSDTISPGQTASGFVFFQLPDKATRDKFEWILQLDAKPLNSESLTSINLKITKPTNKEKS